ncbi:MAG TPA: cytochrome c maturation protein CcmE [Trueperaceae bacterium]|nr:cytochrome c maturation protein CcmE [Trueperaceae bacterium]
MSKKVVYAVLGVLVLGAAALMIARALQTSLVYFVLPSEYARDAASFDGRKIRLAGLVQPGSVGFDDAELQLTFNVTDTYETYQVRYDGAPPEMFQENGGVVIEGSFHEGVFQGDNLLVKHSNDYHPPEEGEAVDVEELKESLR